MALEGFLSTYGGRRGVITIGALRPPSTLSLLSLGELLGWPVLTHGRVPPYVREHGRHQTLTQRDNNERQSPQPDS